MTRTARRTMWLGAVGIAVLAAGCEGSMTAATVDGGPVATADSGGRPRGDAATTDDAGGGAGTDAGAPGSDAGVAPDAALGVDAGVPSAGCASDPACTHYVAPGGDDGAAGALDAPFATLQHAMDVASAGDVVCARAGDYSGVAIARSGTAEAPIVLRSYPGEVANVRGSVGFFAGWGVEVGWIWVLGLDITEPTDASGECVYFHSAHDIVLRGNHIHDCYGQGLLGNAADTLIDSNRIHHCGLHSLSHDTDNNKLHGIYLTGTAITIVNNVIHSNAAYGVQVAGYPYDPADPNHPAGPRYAGASDWVIGNNTIALNQNRSAIVVWQPLTVNALIQNNIFYENGQYGPYAGGTNGIDFYNSGGGHVVRNNLYFGSAVAIADTMAGGGSHTETSPLSGDPRFADVGSDDYHVMAGSPAVDAGEGDRAPARDAECNARAASTIDLGAYER